MLESDMSEPVDRDEIIKGYQVSRGQYVLLEDEEIEAVAIDSKRTLELVREMRSASEARRCAVAATVAMAGDSRRCMNSPIVCVPDKGRSRNSARRC